MAGLKTLLSDVTAFSIQTYDQDDGALPLTCTGGDCDKVRRVELDVTVSRQAISESLKSKVYLRSSMSGGA